MIIEAKYEYLSKLDDPDAAPRTSWSIKKNFLNNIKIPIMSTVYFEGKLISDFEKMLNFLTITLSHNVLWSKMQVHYQTLNIKSMGD